MSQKQIQEDLSTPFFQGDDISANAALQYWTSIFGVFSSLESNVQDNVNKLAILNSLSSMIASKISALNTPAQSSMAVATAGTVPAPNASTPVMSVMPEPVPTPDPVVSPQLVSPECDQDEDEEEIESDEYKAPQETPPSVEADGPEVVNLGDPEEKENDEADKDKKAVVDLTIEARDEIKEGKLTSFKFWYGTSAKDVVKRARELSDKDLVTVASWNPTTLKGAALLQVQAAKREAERRHLDINGKKQVSEETKRMMELAGIRVRV